MRLSEYTKTEINMSKLYVIGTGPGGLEYLPPIARKAIEDSDDVEFNQYLDEYFAYLNE